MQLSPETRNTLIIAAGVIVLMLTVGYGPGVIILAVLWGLKAIYNKVRGKKVKPVE